MREVYAVGVGITSFTRLEYPIVEIAAYPAVLALQDCGLDRVDHVYVANMGAGRVNHQTALGSAVVDHLSLTPALTIHHFLFSKMDQLRPDDKMGIDERSARR